LPPPQANAVVTLVKGKGASSGDDWDTAGAGAVGPQKWASAARAYYRETTDRVTGAGALDVLVRRELILETADVDAMALDTDDVVTFTLDGEAGARQGSAKTIRRTKLAGVPRPLQTTLIVLEDA